MKADKLKAKLLKGHFVNWSFSDAMLLAKHCGWKLARSNGSHQILRHSSVGVSSLNFQEAQGQAKAYQMKQMKEEIELHQL
jgi:hypothetical protein